MDSDRANLEFRVIQSLLEQTEVYLLHVRKQNKTKKTEQQINCLNKAGGETRSPVHRVVCTKFSFPTMPQCLLRKSLAGVQLGNLLAAELELQFK